MNRWPHQAEFLPRCLAAIASGQRRICVQSPTGMGKTVMMQDLARDYLERGLTAILYTNRTSLIEQTSRVMDAAGIRHGVISPDHDDEGHLPFQVGMVQTVHNRAMKRQTMKLHDADLAIFDEAHLQTGESALAIMEAHHAAGAAIVGFTATPIDLGAAYSTILCAGTASEGRACGALLLATHYAPDEPDWKEFNKLKKGRKISEEADSISAAEAKSAIMRPDVFGRVIRHYREYNPEGVPTILFAPDVAGSIAFAEQFTLAGIEAAHIDGENVWAKGRLYRSRREQRDSVLNAVRDGRCKVICNRFVLREGIDLPEIGHCVLATVFGSLSSYLQSVGRALRFHHSLAARGITIQDHGGHWWRFGSPNADRQWHLGCTNSMMLGLHADRMRATRPEAKPSRCPKCGMVQIWRSAICQHCAFECQPGRKVSRPVIQMDGSLREMVGDVFRPHRICNRPNGRALWERMYYRSLTAKANKRCPRTFRMAAALFAQENYWAWPDRRWPFMPIHPLDWFRPVRDIPLDNLIQKE